MNYIDGMFGLDERFNDMDEDEKTEALDDIAWDYRERLNDAEVKDEFELASEAFEKYFEEREAQKGISDMGKLEKIIGYAGAKKIIDGFQSCGDWEYDAINLTNALQRYYYDDVGVFNDGIREAIDRTVSAAIKEAYPNKDFIVNHDGILCEAYPGNGGRYEIEVTIDVVGENEQDICLKMAGNDLETLKEGLLPAVQKACAERGYLDNQVIVGVLIEKNGEWLDSDEETFDLSELNVEICVYKDSLGYIDNDNVTYILVPKAWLLDKLKDEGQLKNAVFFPMWLGEYTADNTDMIAREAVSEGVVFVCNAVNTCLNLVLICFACGQSSVTVHRCVGCYGLYQSKVLLSFSTAINTIAFCTVYSCPGKIHSMISTPNFL